MSDININALEIQSLDKDFHHNVVEVSIIRVVTCTIFPADVVMVKTPDNREREGNILFKDTEHNRSLIDRITLVEEKLNTLHGVKSELIHQLERISVKDINGGSK